MSGAGWPSSGVGRGQNPYGFPQQGGYQAGYSEQPQTRQTGGYGGAHQQQPLSPFQQQAYRQPLQPLGAPSGPSNPFAGPTTATRTLQPSYESHQPPSLAPVTTQSQILQPLKAPSESGRRAKVMNSENGRTYHYSKTESELINSCRNNGMTWQKIADTCFPGKTATSIRLHHDRYNNNDLGRRQNA